MSETVAWVTSRTDEQALAEVRELFTDNFAGSPHVIASAPGRANLIGEHVDYAAGVCLPFAISQRTWVAARPTEDGKYHVVSRMPATESGVDPEVVHSTIDVDAVGPQSHRSWEGYIVGTIWAAAEAGLISAPTGCELAIISDVPLSAGLSSSAALECSVAMAANALWGKADTELTSAQRHQWVDAAMRAENEVVGAATGGLDQRISLCGAEGHALAIDFMENTDELISCDFAADGLAILVMNTRAHHNLADGQYESRRAVVDAVAEYLGEPIRTSQDAEKRAQEWARENVPADSSADQWQDVVTRRVRHIGSEITRTQQAADALRAGDWKQFGALQDQSHESLRDDYEVSCPELDSAVEAALAAGAVGARMTGGGFGGSAIALIQADDADKVAQAVTDEASKRGLVTPEFLLATPSSAARVDWKEND